MMSRALQPCECAMATAGKLTSRWAMAVVECSEHRGEKKLMAIEGSGMDGPRGHAIGGDGVSPCLQVWGPGRERAHAHVNALHSALDSGHTSFLHVPFSPLTSVICFRAMCQQKEHKHTARTLPKAEFTCRPSARESFNRIRPPRIRRPRGPTSTSRSSSCQGSLRGLEG